MFNPGSLVTTKEEFAADNKVIPAGLLGVVNDSKFNTDQRVSVVFADARYFDLVSLRYLQPAKLLSFSDAKAVLEDVTRRRSYCKHAYYFNVKMYHWQLPDVLRQLLPNRRFEAYLSCRLEDFCRIELESFQEDMRTVLMSLDVSGVYLTGRMGGWLTLELPYDPVQNAYESYEFYSDNTGRYYYGEDIWPLDKELSDPQVLSNMLSLTEDDPEVWQEIVATRKEIITNVRYTGTLVDFLGKYVQARLYQFEESLSALETWEPFLQDFQVA
ncbi:hypothetical protein MTAT_19610 [Moorella thermoacetica]|uniref:Uncharacterized protein n=1 Tax=Neomoorella thermoacetica TaxID=1525 RepID=A0AAC9MVG8_NEOTH|nr:hypothetical protein [Moorella thermoacetica]AOQ24616.1 hypothetical protein Maut_02188 [Moorella thermoacetica]TYL12719.1 hypothetical protein MTAT_19610 [Moorella thermoacetica]